jgi:hypothetical protein
MVWLIEEIMAWFVILCDILTATLFTDRPLVVLAPYRNSCSSFHSEESQDVHYKYIPLF